MYFENQGSFQLTNSDWKLLIYVKLDNFDQHTSETMALTHNDYLTLI